MVNRLRDFTIKVAFSKRPWNFSARFEKSYLLLNSSLRNFVNKNHSGWTMAQIEDPTLTALKDYDLSGAEATVSLVVLTLTIITEIIKKFIPPDNSPVKYQIVRTPESSFRGVREPYGAQNYFYFNYKGQKLRVHYVDSGDRGGKVLLCLHGEPFWSQSYRKLIPYLVKSGYRVIAPDFVGFGRSDKFVDWRAYTLPLHTETIVALMRQLNLSENVTLIGHNWGFLAGIHVLKSHPDWFDSLVILNTNNLPDGEVDKSRFSSPLSLLKYLKYDAYFLVFHSAMGLLKAAFPLSLLYSAMNFGYTEKDKRDFMAPFQRPEDLGGVISFPLLVPVKPTDRYVSDMRSARIFLKTQWKKPTLIMYSKSAFLPFSFGDFVVGNRRGFFEKLLPHAFVTPRIPGGHLIYYDNPKAVSNYITNFLK